MERLLEELVQLTGETKTEAVRKALEELRQRLALGLATQQENKRLLSFLQDEVWPQIPAEMLGTGLTKEEEENILGYGVLGT